MNLVVQVFELSISNPGDLNQKDRNPFHPISDSQLSHALEGQQEPCGRGRSNRPHQTIASVSGPHECQDQSTPRAKALTRESVGQIVRARLSLVGFPEGFEGVAAGHKGRFYANRKGTDNSPVGLSSRCR